MKSEMKKPRDRDREVKCSKNSRELSRNETLAGYCSTIKNSGQIYVVEKGRIIEHGTHDQLISMRASYFKLWNSNTSWQVFNFVDHCNACDRVKLFNVNQFILETSLNWRVPQTLKNSDFKPSMTSNGSKLRCIRCFSLIWFDTGRVSQVGENQICDADRRNLGGRSQKVILATISWGRPL